jgi:superfamily II DNA or RNA helicase
MIPTITDSLISGAIQTETMVNAGAAYWQQGRVAELAIDNATGAITADVRGSARHPYEVTIIFNADDPEFPVEVDCSCPVGFGCKHGAAVLYAARATLSKAAPMGAGQKMAPPATRAPLPQPLFLWLAEAQAHRPQNPGNGPAIAYVISPRVLHPIKKRKGEVAPGEIAEPFELSVRVWLKQRAPDGRYAWHEPNRYDRNWIGLAPTSLDAWLLRRLTDYNGDMAGGTARGLAGGDWIDKAIGSGSARWRNPDGPMLDFGGEISAAFRWATVGEGDQRLTLADLPPGMTLVALAPPLAIDGGSGIVHRISSGVESMLAERLLRLPPVTPQAVPALADHWDTVVGAAVPAPTLKNLVDKGKIAPTPVLTFRDEAVDVYLPSRSRYRAAPTVRASMAVARLSFAYEGTIVTHATAGTLLVSVTDEATIQFQRDLAAEEQAHARLAALGLKRICSFDQAKAKASQAWDLAIGIGAMPADYADILLNHVPRLKEEGWRITYAPRWSLAFVEIEPDSLKFDVEPSGIDWFDIGLGARIDGKVIDILPLLRRMLAQHGAALLDHPGELLTIEIVPGKLAQAPMEKLRPVLEMLLMLAVQDRHGSGKLRLPARDLAALADFEGGTNTHIAWTGAEPLRALARALSHRELAAVKTPNTFTATLRPYQQEGVNWLQALHSAGFGGVLADDMGLGKTVQALAHITTLKAAGALEGPVLIVCPTSVLPNWQSELTRFAPELSVLLWHGATRRTLVCELAQQDVILTSYPLLVRDVDLLKKQSLSIIIHDEAQMLKNPKTAGFKAARQMNAKQAIALTGTPVENQLTDAWSLMDLVTPGLLGSLDQFSRGIARPITRDDDAAAKTMLARRLRPFMLRRTKDQVARDLPAKTEIPEWIDLGGTQLALYESMRLLMQKRVSDEIARVGLMRSHIVFLDALLKLRQICCDPRLLAGQPAATGHSAKLSRLMEMLPELLAEGGRVILFSQFTSMLDLIKPELGKCLIPFTEIRGTTKDRLGPVAAFQAGKAPVILVSLKAGGTGLNLTAADTVILYDPWWNPAVEAQAIDRAHRIGQTKPVFVHRLIARNTIEEKILALQDTKRSLAATLWGEGDGAAPVKLTEEDVQFLLG